MELTSVSKLPQHGMTSPCSVAKLRMPCGGAAGAAHIHASFGTSILQ